MNAAGIQAKINRGGAIAAKKLGQVCDQRRPWRAINPLGDESRMGRIMAFFDPDFQFQAKKPNLYGKPVWGVLLDRGATRVGDYLYAPSGTYFLVGQQPLLPTAAVECNAVITITRAAGDVLATEDVYSGRTDGSDVPIMQGWPAAVLEGGRQEQSRAGLPGDAPMKGRQVFLPYWSGVIIRTTDRITDTTTNVTMTVGSAELTDLGWRLACSLAEI